MLRFVRVVLLARKMTVVVDDQDGHRRAVDIRLMAKDAPDLPPEGWWDMVVGEVEYQRMEEKSGRVLL